VCGLFDKYESEVLCPVSINSFIALCKELHVHFHVGAVDMMSCVVCRKWQSELEDLGLKLNDATAAVQRTRIQRQIEALTVKFEKHQLDLVMQLKAWREDVDAVQKDKKLMLVVIDYSTFELMDRKKNKCFMCNNCGAR